MKKMAVGEEHGEAEDKRNHAARKEREEGQRKGEEEEKEEKEVRGEREREGKFAEYGNHLVLPFRPPRPAHHVYVCLLFDEESENLQIPGPSSEVDWSKASLVRRVH